MINYRKALTKEFSSLKNFIFKHGPNPWNYLPEGYDKTFSLIPIILVKPWLPVMGKSLLAWHFSSIPLPCRNIFSNTQF